MGRVGDEALLTGERPIESFEHLVERVGELLELIRRAVQGDALVEVDIGEAPGRGRDRLEGAQHPARDHPAQADRHHGHDPERDP